MPGHFRFPRVVCAVLIATIAATIAACGNDAAPTTPTTTTTAAAVEVYIGTLQPGQLGFYSFQATGSGTASITFASLTNAASNRTLDLPLQVGVGIPAAEGCAVTNAITTTPRLSAQLTHPVVAGTYCVQLLDPGVLGAAVNFAVRIQRP